MASTRLLPAARSWFFLAMAWLAVAVAVIGFTRTFFLPLLDGGFQALPFVFWHSALLFGWVGLFAMQVTLVETRRHALHRKLGWIGLALAAGVAWSTVVIGVQAMRRDLAAGAGEFATSSLVGVCFAMLGFLLLVALGIHFRRRSDIHKRLMLLATIAVLWPAWFRFRHYFPSVPVPEIWFALVAADSLVLVAMWHDWRTRGRVHPALGWGGTALVADHVTETILFDGPGWRVLAHWLAGVLA